AWERSLDETGGKEKKSLFQLKSGERPARAFRMRCKVNECRNIIFRPDGNRYKLLVTASGQRKDNTTLPIHHGEGQHNAETATVTNFEGFGELTNVISTEKTKANLSCESGDMVVKLQFAEKFRGVVYADRDRQSACKKYGDGSTFYVFQIPLQGCGTKERVTSDYRMFVNDIIVRFHPTLELEGDEVKTILCRYPPPVAPLPPPVVPLPIEVPAVVAAGPRQLSEVELMLIICAILFLALLLLGVGLAYYCLKKRNIKIVKRRKISSGPPSQITKLSGSTLGPLSIPFDGIRIPRATAHSVSGSEALLTLPEQSDTITSDYPSESLSSTHSDIEETETRITTSQMTQSAYDNQAYLEERSYPPPPPPKLTSTTETTTKETTTTIYDQENYYRMQRLEQQERFEQQQRYDQQRRFEEQQQRTIDSASFPPYAVDTPIYARIRKQQMDDVSTKNERSISETMQEISRRYPPSSLPSTEPSFAPRRTISEFSEELLSEETTTQYGAKDTTEARSARSLSEIIEPPATRAAETVDSYSRYGQNMTGSFSETTTYEEDEMTKMTRDELLQAHMQSPPIPEFDITIRSYLPASDGENGSSEVETLDQLSIVSERPQILFEKVEDPFPVRHPPPNWDVLIRVLEPPGPGAGESDDVQSILSENDRDKWRAILSSDSTLRTLLSEAKSSEEFEIIRHDQRYERLFSTPAWDVIIRILTNPTDLYDSADSASMSDTASYTSERPAARFRRKSDMEIKGKRISLPPLYEQDVTSRSPLPTHEGGDEMRFVRYERESEYSEDSSAPVEHRRQLFKHHRPSLMRSMSEEMHSPETIEKDSLDEEDYQTDGSYSRAHRVERSSAGMTVRESHTSLMQFQDMI
uniref:ZP-N domain-containing protein n=1 Tax=Strigamia maritima TaxID=126957 RepID=T1IR48_STRMM